MAKTIKTNDVSYDVTADVVVKSDNGMEIVKFDSEGAASKNVRTLKKSITESYEQDGLTVIAIDNIKTTKRVFITTYKVNASNAEIINACREYGLNVEIVLDAVADADEDETA